MLIEGLSSEQNRDNGTSIELFAAGVRFWGSRERLAVVRLAQTAVLGDGSALGAS